MSYDPDDDNPLLGLRFRCVRCKDECGGMYVDNGIGAYEYWGARGRHVQMDLASDCCHADVQELEHCEEDTE
jgi:hypothetical protein